MKFCIQFFAVGMVTLFGAGVEAYNQKKTEQLQKEFEEFDQIQNQGLGFFHWNARATKMRDLCARVSEQVVILVNEGADPDVAMHFAVMARDIALIKFLLERGAQIDKKNADGLTPLMLACTGNEDVIAYLIARGAKVDEKNSKGWTALFFSALYDHVGAIDHILAAGANIEEQNLVGATAFQIAIDYGSVGAALRLLNHGANSQLLRNGYFPLNAIDKTRSIQTKGMVKSFSPQKVIKPDQKTTFDVAIKKGRGELALLQLQMLSATFENALHTGVRFGLAHALTMLLDDLEMKKTLAKLINVPNFYGLTPLDIAFLLRREKIILTLLAHGANPLQGAINGLLFARSTWRSTKKVNTKKLDKLDSIAIAPEKSQVSLLDRIFLHVATPFVSALWPLQLLPHKRSANEEVPANVPDAVPKDVIVTIIQHVLLLATYLSVR